MKFKGVHKSGSHAGQVIEFTNEEKVPFAIQDGVIEHEDYKGHTHVWVRDVKIVTLTETPKGKPLNGVYANNMYSVHGTVTLHRRSLQHDALMPPQTRTFNIKFEDTLDNIGQPDLKVSELWLREQ